MDQSKFIDLIPKKHREEFLSSLLEAYVDKQGLGGMPKADFDALVVYLYVKYALETKFDAFRAAQALMLKDSRAKSLYETGLIKYGGLTEGSAWKEILQLLSHTDYELESYERGQIRFRFENPALYKFFHVRLRRVARTATYSQSYETVVIGLESFLLLLDHIYEKSQTDFKTTEMEAVQPLVEPVIKRIGISLGKKKIKELTGGEKSKSAAGQALEYGSKLASIGSFVSKMLLVAAV